MESPELSFTLAYFVFALCFIFTPNEFRAAGLTIQNVFASWLGSEDVGFIQYHLKRTSITVLVHSALPLGYYLGMCIAAPEKNLAYIHQVSEGWWAFLLLSVGLQLGSWTLVVYWSCWRWHQHPISRTLQAHARPPHPHWGSVASSVNTEFRRIDKFATGVPGARVIVTDSWVMKVTTYHVYLALQSDCHLTVTESRQHELSPDSASPIEILTLRVESINPAVSAFSIRCVCVCMTAPPNTTAHKPNRQTQKAPKAPAGTKLVRLCQAAGSDQESECQQCFCRPMWCLMCLGRWFASRQDQQRPETWLSSRVPCPTCRAKFCILDVCVVR
ncbi:unnamed protein product [Menidia menidia]|uniref:(Atlantic silverside) hypothetical protein n=1 Tax=Menidia menidia TaxID=238744 RepID=A0A8S4BQ21_9TELE|nr:unnamed protein product [Menidia menidia]